MTTEHPYTLDISLNVLNHLGLNLYSNVPAVLSELVANAWDADATEVSIDVKGKGKDTTIEIRDNGCGMDAADINGKFLKVGYERRKTSKQDFTSLGRPVMGRKGIGKLSVFSIADYIEVYTRKEGEKVLGLILDRTEIEKAITDAGVYNPEPKHNPQKFGTPSGTILILKKLRKQISKSISEDLKRRVARRFTIIGSDFSVKVNGSKIGASDRDYVKNLEFVYTYSDPVGIDLSNVTESEKRKAKIKIEEDGRFREVSGWIGLAKKTSFLKTDSGDNLNRISILSRGKVALEDVLEQLSETGIYSSYLIGEINADFLDETELDDIATSSRQNIISTDSRFPQLRDFIHGELKDLQQKRAELKAKNAVDIFNSIPPCKKWLENLESDDKKYAENLLGKVNQISNDEDGFKVLAHYCVLAFEHLQHKRKLSELEYIDIKNLQKIVEIFSTLRDIEAASYHKITRGRIEMIEKLRKFVDNNAYEHIIQEHLFDHLWLLDPAWDRNTRNIAMEEAAKSAFDDVPDNLTEEERAGRIDIRYANIQNEHVIVELKRPSTQVTLLSILEQVEKYRSALRKLLESKQIEFAKIKTVCLVEKVPSAWSDSRQRDEDIRTLAEKDIEIRTYSALLENCEKNYKEYFEMSRKTGRIQEILDSIDEVALGIEIET